MIETNCSTAQIHPSDFSDILAAWNIELYKTRPEISIQGSPQRCIYRMVVENHQHQKYILEQIPRKKYTHKKLIAKTLKYLINHNTKNIISYLTNKQGNDITKVKDTYWQLQPYVEGIALDRPSYVFDQWRATSLAHFLIQLYQNSTEIQKEINLCIFSLKDYISNMIKDMKYYNPSEYQQILPIITYLQTTFFPSYDTIPQRFCHGDYHPLNIIWDKKNIKAVIDWEFSGIKTEIYDMANLLGCIGIEEPTSLMNDLAIGFIKTMKKSAIIHDSSWAYLYECMLALRFAWLAEWLRTKDTEMIQMEIDYLNLLYKNKDNITSKWKIPSTK